MRDTPATGVSEEEGERMLILARKLGEKIVIGQGAEAITITLVDIDRNVMRLGIDAPRDVPIWRQEPRPRARPQRRLGRRPRAISGGRD